MSSLLRKAAVTLAIISSLTIASNAGRACKGLTPCAACKNCHGCKWCAKDGGTCGVCKSNAAKERDHESDPRCSSIK
jgi:hypothetical protein